MSRRWSARGPPRARHRPKASISRRVFFRGETPPTARTYGPPSEGPAGWPSAVKIGSRPWYTTSIFDAGTPARRTRSSAVYCDTATNRSARRTAQGKSAPYMGAQLGWIQLRVDLPTEVVHGDHAAVAPAHRARQKAVQPMKQHRLLVRQRPQAGPLVEPQFPERGFERPRPACRVAGPGRSPARSADSGPGATSSGRARARRRCATGREAAPPYTPRSRSAGRRGVGR